MKRWRMPGGLVVTDRHGRALWRLGPGAARHATPELPVHDQLTGLLSRAALLEAVSRELARIARGGPPATLAVLDLDDFKQVNARFGHDGGDRALADVAAVIAGNVRSQDRVGRLGGDDLAVLLPATDTDEAVAVVDRAVTLVHDHVTTPDGKPVSLSTGLTLLPHGARDTAVVLGYAIDALHVAKARQRGGLVVAHQDMFEQLRGEFAELSAAAESDHRTGLANVRRFEADLRAAHDRILTDGQPYGLLLVDVDRFHDYNRTHGMLAGDQALRQIAQALVDTLPDTTVYRYGGEEFTVLLPAPTTRRQVDAAGQQAVAAVRALQLPHDGLASPGMVTVTAAGALARPGDDVAGAFSRADGALVAGKAAGRDRYAGESDVAHSRAG